MLKSRSPQAFGFLLKIIGHFFPDKTQSNSDSRDIFGVFWSLILGRPAVFKDLDDL